MHPSSVSPRCPSAPSSTTLARRSWRRSFTRCTMPPSRRVSSSSRSSKVRPTTRRSSSPSRRSTRATRASGKRPDGGDGFTGHAVTSAFLARCVVCRPVAAHRARGRGRCGGSREEPGRRQSRAAPRCSLTHRWRRSFRFRRESQLRPLPGRVLWSTAHRDRRGTACAKERARSPRSGVGAIRPSRAGRRTRPVNRAQARRRGRRGGLRARHRQGSPAARVPPSRRAFSAPCLAKLS